MLTPLPNASCGSRSHELIGPRPGDFLDAEALNRLGDPSGDRLQVETILHHRSADLNIELRSVRSTGPENITVLTLRDITARTPAEELRRDLLDMTLHDLKIPLTGILGFAELWGEDASGGHEDAAFIVEAALRMRGMLAEMLDISRLETGQMPVRPELFLIADQISATLRSMSPKARSRVDCLVSSKALVQADPELVHRVLENLLSNALKYGPETTPVCVTVEARHGEVRIAVTDQGTGVAQEDQARIFEKYGQVGGGTRYSTGIGLTCCRMAVEANGGAIGVESELGAAALSGSLCPRRNRRPK